MAALTTFQGVADETEVIPSEQIGTFIAAYEFKVPVGLAVAWARPGKGSIPQTYPRWDEMASGVPSAKTESDEFAEREIAMSESTITPALYGFAIKRSDEAMEASPNGVEAGLLAEAINYLIDDMDDSVLGSMTSITASEGLVTDTYDLDRWRSDVAAYKLLNVRRGPMGHVALLSSTMSSQLTGAIETSGATVVVGRGDTLALGPEDGYIGTRNGFGIYETQGLPASTTGRAGGMFPAGQMASPLGVVVTELPNVRSSGQGDSQNDLRAISQHVFRCWYGVGVTNPRKGQQILGPT